jgi:hypothetical protein
MEMPSTIAVSTTSANRARPDPGDRRSGNTSDATGMTASQMHRTGGTAAETPETEAVRAAVFREAANAAGPFLTGGRGRPRDVQATGIDVPQGFKNVQLANQAIEYVQNISRVSTTRPSHLFSQIVRDDTGRLDWGNSQSIRSTLKPDAMQHMIVLREFRDEAGKAARLHIESEQAKGARLTHHEQFAMWLRHGNAVLLEKAKNMGADQLVANCSEKAMLAFDMLANQEDNPHLDVVALVNTKEVTAFAAITGVPTHLAQGPDHALLIIGRDPRSDIADPGTWGDDTVICDPWAQRTYAVSAYKEEMELLSSTTNGQTHCEAHISWPANTPYTSDPTVIYREKDGIGG